MAEIREIVPFAPSVKWYAQWLRAIAETSSEAPEEDESLYPVMEGRDIARCLISGNNGFPVRLSVAVKGGAGVLKGKLPKYAVEISEHGNWRHTHLGTMEASYGKLPYYPYLIPALKRVYNTPFVKLSSFNFAIHKQLLSFLMQDIQLKDLTVIFTSRGSLLERGKEIANEMHPEHSILDGLMRFGPETLLALATIR